MKYIFSLLMLVLCFVFTAQAQLASQLGSPGGYKYGLFTGSAYLATNDLSGATSYTVNSDAVTVRKGQGISIFVQVANTNASTGSNQLTFYLTTTLDKTNWCTYTLSPLYFTVYSAPVTTNGYWTNFPSSLLNNVQQVRVGTITATNDTYKVKTLVTSYGYWAD